MNQRDVPRLELSDDECALAVEENLHDLFRSMALLPGAEVEELGRYSRHHAAPSNPMFKGVWGTRLALDEIGGVAEEALAWHRERGAPFVFWWAGAGTAPADHDALDAHLGRHGFSPWDLGYPGQVAELAGLDWDALARVPDGFQVERVVDENQLEAFGATFVEAFEVPEWAGRAWVDATRSLGIDRAPWDIYLGRIGDRPVATNVLFCGAGVASVFGIATMADVRGQGVGAAITLAGLADAREWGYRYAVLFATELGAPVYRRIGFRDTGATISRWLWMAE